jgi:uncharacterized protein (DUF3084 family)
MDASDVSRLETRLHELESELQETRTKYGSELAAVTTQAKLLRDGLTSAEQRLYALTETAHYSKGQLQMLSAGHRALRKTLDKLLLKRGCIKPRKGEGVSPATDPAAPPANG